MKKGRHAVVEKVMGTQEYIPNTITFDADINIQLITGPNMSGKSTYMRQLALTVIMAQMGSYVAAESVNLPVFDAIFTRIGAADDLISGQSTFMVEMMEANQAIKRASSQSLILFDELGRGTAPMTVWLWRNQSLNISMIILVQRPCLQPIIMS